MDLWGDAPVAPIRQTILRVTFRGGPNDGETADVEVIDVGLDLRQPLIVADGTGAYVLDTASRSYVWHSA